MLLTYFHQKFRKAAPTLVVLQLLAFLVFLAYQKYSEKELPDLEGYSLLLEGNNQLWWSELSYQVAYLESRLHRSGGSELVDRINKVLDIAGKYHKKIYHFQEKADSITRGADSPSTAQKELLELTRLEKWSEKVEQYLFDYREELKQKTLLLNGYAKSEQEKKRREILYSEEILDKLNLKQSFQQSDQIALALSTVQMLFMNIAKHHIDFIHSHIALRTIIFDECVAEVVPSMKTLYEGEIFKASIFLSQRAPFVPQYFVVEGDTLKKDRFNRATYQIKTDKVGTHTFEGKIHVKNQYGRVDAYRFQQEYTVLPKCN